jgi:hypothetical protein
MPNPLEIFGTGLKRWYRASDLSLADAAAVSSWACSAGSGDAATQGTAANRPTYIADGGNGYPCVRFDGSNDYLSVGYTGEPRTIWVVGRIRSTSGDQHWAGGDTSDAVALGSWYFKPTNGGSTSGVPFQVETMFSRSTSADTTGAADFIARKTTLAPQVSDGWMVWIGTQDGTTIRLRAGREIVGSDTTGNALRPINAMVIGAAYYSDTVLSFLNGDIAEMGICAVAATDRQIEQLLDYLARYFGDKIDYDSAHYIGTFNGTQTEPAAVFLKSDDGIVFSKRAGQVHWPTLGSCRDAYVFKHPLSGKLYALHTDGYPSGTFVDCNGFGVAHSSDGVYWRTINRVSMASVLSGTQRRVWSPTPVLDRDGLVYVDSDGKIYLTVTTSTDNWTSASTMYLVSLSGPDLSVVGTPVALTGTALPPFQIGGSVMRLSDSLWLFCTKREQQAGVDAELKFVTAAGMSGPYNTLRFDAASWGQVEGGLLHREPDDTLVVYYDRFVAGTGMARRTSTDDGVSWSSETSITGDGTFTVRNGGATQVYPNASTNDIYQRTDVATSTRSTLTSGQVTAAVPTASQNATAVRGELATELGRIDINVSSRLAAASYTAPPSASAIASAVWSAGSRTLTGFGSLVADIASAVWAAAARTLTADPGVGVGDTLVTANTGGVDNLRLVTAGGQGIDGAEVTAYTKAEYDADPKAATPRGRTVTRSDGRFAVPLALNAGVAYTLTYNAAGYSLATKEVTP